MTGGTPEARWPAVAVPAVVGLLAAWSVAPLSVPFVGTDPGILAGMWRLWLWGALIAGGLTAVLEVLSRGAAGRAVYAVWERVCGAAPRRFLLVTAAAFAAGALAFTLLVFVGNPRNVDGFAQLFQARIFLAGRLWLPPPPELASFGTLHMILGPDRWFAQYPPGQSVVLALGLAAGAWWLLLPLWAAALVLLTYRLGRWVGGESDGRLAALLLCLSPFALAVSGSEMSHLPAAVLGAGAACAAMTAGGGRPRLAGFGAGAALGLMVAFRPLDAVAAVAPTGLILLLVARSRARVLAAAAAGGVLASLPTLWYNAATTGHWRTFGYTALWGPNHSLGFHDVPWGIPLTPLRAAGLTALDLFQLNQYLLDFPLPILLVVAAGFVAGRRRASPGDAVAVAGVVALVGLLFFYWHRDVFYGPRFLFSALPWVAVVTGRGMALLGGAMREHPRLRAVPLALLMALGVGAVVLTPDRLRAYRASTPNLNLHPDRAAAGLERAVVLIPDGWGSRIIARMWEAGIPVQRTARLYAGIDACTLEQALDHADAEPAARARLEATLDSLTGLRRPGVPAGLTDDRALRLLPGAPLPGDCAAEIRFDQRGFLAFAPFLYLNRATLDGPVVWARDLRDRNDALRRRYPDRQFYRFAPAVPGAEPTLSPVSD